MEKSIHNFSTRKRMGNANCPSTQMKKKKKKKKNSNEKKPKEKEEYLIERFCDFHCVFNISTMKFLDNVSDNFPPSTTETLILY